MFIGTDIDYAAQAIRDGKLVVFPTETVYGLGANAFDAYAVAKVFEVKERPTFDPLIVHISSIHQLDRLFQSPVNPQVYRLAEAFWPGPLTIVHLKTHEVPDLVTSGLPTVAVRMPSHPMAQELIEKAGTPIAAPSANRFGYLSPTQAQHVVKQLSGPDYLLDGGQTDYGIESTVVTITDAGVRILRHGAIPAEALAEHVTLVSEETPLGTENLPSPGMLKSHYAPRKPLYVLESTAFQKLPKNSGLIVSSTLRATLHPNIKTVALSENGDLSEMAVNLFTALHTMEEDDEVSEIYIEPVSEIGVGRAIMDRIRKAAFSYLKKKEE